MPGHGTNTGSRLRTMRNGAAASNSAAPAWGVVRTATSSGGKRRHSSQRYDWMPPTLGGKSLVTSRWRTVSRSSRHRQRVELGLHDWIVVTGRQQVGPSQLGGGPDGVGPDDGIFVVQGGRQRSLDLRLAAVAAVAQHDQGVAADVPSLPAWDVPAAEVVEDLVVGGGQQIKRRHLWLVRRGRGR